MAGSNAVRTQHARNRWTLGVAIIGLACMASCSDQPLDAAPRDAASIVRLRFEHEGAVAPVDDSLQSVARFEVTPEQLRGWNLHGTDEAPRSHKIKGLSKRRPGLRVTGAEGGSIHIPCELKAGSVNRAAVQIMCNSKVDVSVALMRRGEIVHKSIPLRHTGSGRLDTLLIDIPGVFTSETDFDGVRVLIGRLKHDSSFFGVDLLQVPLASFLPSDPTQLESVGIGNESRTCLGLRQGAPLTAQAEATPGGILRLGMARPAEVLRPQERPRVLVEVFERDAPGSAPLAQDSFRLPGASGAEQWEDVELTIPLERPTEITVRLELKSAFEGSSVVAISSPRIERRWAGPKTVVLVTSDTHRNDHLGASPTNAGVQTPFLDRLAAGGVMFEDAYASTNITNPSHASIMTALSPRDTRMIDNNTVLAEQATTLAECYQEAGFFTIAALSAGHMNHRQSGLSQGFDRLWVPSGKTDVDSRISIKHLDGWLDQAQGLPLFVWLHVFDAHTPYVVPSELRWRYYDRDRDPYDESLPPMPAGGRVPWDAAVRDLEYVKSQYMSEVTYLDSQLEGFLAHPRLSTGIIALTGDHGESFGEHGLYYTHQGLFPDTLAIPLILNWPGGPSGVRVRDAVDHLDLGRTLLDISGLAQSEFPGRNLMRWVDGDTQPQPRFAISSHAHAFSIESEGWFLVVHARNTRKPERVAHQVELYFLPDDPGCETDLVDSEFERARVLRKQLLTWLEDASATGLSQATGPQSVEELAQLAALGYASQEAGPAHASEGAGWYREDPKDPWCQRFH